MRLMAVMNQKGGVGKSTTTMNVAHALAQAGHTVTAVDMDPQGHLAAGLGVATNGNGGIDAVLLDGAALREVLIDAREHLRLAPAGPKLSEFELVSQGGAKRGWYLRDALTEGLEGQDFVLIDCPPSTGLLTMNAMFAAEEVLIPVAGDYLALHGLSRFMQILSHIDASLGRKTRTWVTLTRFHGRRRLAQDVRDKLVEYFPSSVLQTPVRECVALAESPSFGQTIFEYQKHSNGADDYRSLAADLINERTL